MSEVVQPANGPQPVTTTPKQRGGVTGRGFVPGASGNPRGRPKGAVAHIKKLTGGEAYPKIWEGLAAIAWGTPQQREAFFGEAFNVSAKDRLRAIEMLRDSGPGKPKQIVDLDAPIVPLFTLPPGCMPDVSGTREA